MLKNLPLMTDSYKFSQYPQYAENTTRIYDYLESRGGVYDKTVFFGLQYYFKEYLTKQVTMKDVDLAKAIVDIHMGPGIFNYEGWKYIVEKHDGYLPLEIKAVPEGTVVGTRNIMASVINTDPKCAWLSGYVETLLMKVWAPINVATTSFECKKIIKKYLQETADNLDGLLFKLHDFGYRGVSSEESAGICGMAHCLNFMGSDTAPGYIFPMQYYGGEGYNDLEKVVELLVSGALTIPANSIPASEHSTMTCLGPEGEFPQMERFLDVFAESPIKACVSDSFNIKNAIKFWGTMKEKIIAQGTILVVRPDSGDPVQMSLECAMDLDREFGHTMTQENSYKLLKNVRVIYGDGISSPKVIEQILANAKAHGYSAENFAFGMGGGLLQKNDRDTQKFAMKCSASVIDGVTHEVFKDPITDPGKVSKKGYLDLIKVGDDYTTIQVAEYGGGEDSELVTVFRNGKILVDYTFDEIKERLRNQGY